ncbi:MAG: PKD domain-containing protein [Bacteroidota bacterium]|jgi:PKD repeat protein
MSVKFLVKAGALFLLIISSFNASACPCSVTATQTGSDLPGFTTTITNFSCGVNNPVSASLAFNYSTPCNWTLARVIIDGVELPNSFCSGATVDLTPFMPLSSVAVRVYDNPSDNYNDNVTVNMAVTLSDGQQQAVAFDAPDYICFGDPVPFANNSQCISGYQWDFGDGSTSTQASPSHTYAEAGYYWVTLRGFNALGVQVGTTSQYVIVGGHRPKINITKDTVCVGDEITFWDAAYFNNTFDASYSINFGDGTTQTSDNNWFTFFHAYTATGNYPVTLTVNSECGTQIIDTMIHVGSDIPVQSFLEVGWAANNPICPGTMVNLYTDWSQSYLFNYGDGTTGTAGNHVYSNYGTYYPTVTVQNGCGNTATYEDIPVVVSDVNYFTGSASISVDGNSNATFCPGAQIRFYGPPATTYLWNFGDGGTSNIMEPYHAFNNPGQYNVGLTLMDGCGNDTTVYLAVNITNNIPVDPNVEFSQLPEEICVGDAFIYDISGAWLLSQQGGSFTWDFGDGNTSDAISGYHAYAASGTYTVSCTIENSCGNDTTLYTSISAGSNVPPGNFLATTIQDEFCPGDNIMLLTYPYSASNTVVWNMGNNDLVTITDSLALSAEESEMVFHQGYYLYTVPGVYNVQVSLTNGCGLTATEDIVLTIAPGSEIEEAGFFVEEDNYFCLNEPLVFRGFGGNEFFWNFGDNSGVELSSQALEPVTHAYAEPGTYTVTMVARNNCGDTVIITQMIDIPDSEMQIITNSSNSNCLESNGTAVAYVVGPNAPFTYVWSNAVTSNINANLSAGTYIVNVTDSEGCVDFALATVSDAEAPTIAVSNVVDVSCYGEDNGAIDITPIGNTEGVTYQWSNGATSQDVSGLVAGPYEVVVTNGQGCISVASVTVEQPGQVELEFTSTQATCGWANAAAAAVVTGTTGPYIYVWSNGDSGPLANGLPAGIHSVAVIDNEGCVTEGSVAISETNAPGIILDSLLDVGCGLGGSGIYVSAIGGTAPYSYLWSNGATGNGISGLAPGEYSLTVSGANGCESNAIYAIEYEIPSVNPICVVTVGPGQHNKVAWEKLAETGVAYYNVYKESSAAGLYYLVGSVPYDSLSTWIDTISNPAVQAYRYKIAAVDSCGTESYLSSHHKTIHLTQNIGLNDEVNLIWDNYEGFSYTSYNVWRYDDADGWQIIATLPSNVNSYTDLNAPMATATSLYYFIDITLEEACVSTRAENNNTTRSNRTEAVAGPLDDTGITELHPDDALIVYPNPSDGIIYLSFNMGNVPVLNYRLIDAQGREISSETLYKLSDGDQHTIDSKMAAAGVYTLQITFGENSFHRRIIIRH